MRLATVLASLALALTASPALAQIGAGGGQILIESDRSELRNDEAMAVFEGAVEATQGDARLRANRIEVAFERAAQSAEPGSMGAMREVTALGEVLYETPEETARSDRAVYNIGANTLVLTGDVVVRQGCDVSIGDRLTVDLTTGNSQLDGRQPAPGESGGRVRVVLYPEGEAEARNNCE